MTFFIKMFFAMCLVLAFFMSPTVMPQAQAGLPTIALSASPNPCAIASSEDVCTTTVTWSSNKLSQIWVDVDNGEKQLFACGGSGSQAASWIVRNHAYRFTMFYATSCDESGRQGEPIATALPVVTVPVIQGWIDSCGASGHGLCKATISYHANALAQVWVQVDNGEGNLMSCSTADSVVVPWIEEGHTYTFSVFNASTCAATDRKGAAIDSLTLQDSLHPQMGLNKFELALQYLGLASGGNGSANYQQTEQAMARKAMFDAHNMGAAYLRVAITGYGPVAYGTQSDLALWQSDPQVYWQNIDLMMADLERYQLKIVPSFVWNHDQFPAITHERLADMMTNPQSKSYQLLTKYISEFITRYKDRPAIEGYEFSNEFNLGADIDGIQYCKSTYGEQAPICVPTSNYTTDQMIAFSTRVAAYIKSLDPHHFVESGYGAPRTSSAHLRKHPCWLQGGCDWTEDTLQQFEQNITDIHQGFDTITLHYYGTANSTFYGLDPYEFLVDAYTTANKAGKPLFLGEYGDTDSVTGHDSPFSVATLKAIKDLGIAYSSPWTLEFYQFNLFKNPGTFNIEPGYCDSFIDNYKSVNNALGNGINLEPPKPQLVITWPINGSTLQPSQTIFAVASQGGTATPVTVALFVDGVLQKIVNAPPYTMQLDTSKLTPGFHMITAGAPSALENNVWQILSSVKVNK